MAPYLFGLIGCHWRLKGVLDALWTRNISAGIHTRKPLLELAQHYRLWSVCNYCVEYWQLALHIPKTRTMLHGLSTDSWYFDVQLSTVRVSYQSRIYVAILSYPIIKMHRKKISYFRFVVFTPLVSATSATITIIPTSSKCKPCTQHSKIRILPSWIPTARTWAF